MITVVDYGMGNLHSVLNALKKYTDEARVSSEPNEVEESDKLVLPGVGAFKEAHDELAEKGLINPISEFIKSGRPFLGLCLGLQLLFTRSYEDGEHSGLGIIEGDVVKFSAESRLKIPHMGWNTINQSPERTAQSCPLLEGIPDGAYMYFVHSYYVVPKDNSAVLTTTDYGISFCSAVWKDNIYAMQFHPEKSQTEGLKIMENFVRL